MSRFVIARPTISDFNIEINFVKTSSFRTQACFSENTDFNAEEHKQKKVARLRLADILNNYTT
jgi:hypothetical protein